MKIVLLGILGLFIITSLSGFVHSPKPITKEEIKRIDFLSGAEIKDVYNQNTLVGNYYKYDSNFTFKFNKDGTFDGALNNGEKAVKGKWQIKGNKNCLVFENKVEDCVKYYKKGIRYYTVNDSMMRTSDFLIKN